MSGDLQDKYQLILVNLLKEDENKYCTDCDAKGPRWASWNLGFFICIRCAGIHRNLGVHISKVKSVNLDSWNELQIATMQFMGNSRARSIYENTMPTSMRRPQTDLSLETFIRNKYEHKLYMGKAVVPKMPTKLMKKPEKKNEVRMAKEGNNEGKRGDGKNKRNNEHAKTLPIKSANMKPLLIDHLGNQAIQVKSTENLSRKPSEDLFGDFMTAPPMVPDDDQTNKDHIMSLFNHSASAPDLQKSLHHQHPQQQQYGGSGGGGGYPTSTFPAQQGCPLVIGNQPGQAPLTNVPARFMNSYYEAHNIVHVPINGNYQGGPPQQQPHPHPHPQQGPGQQPGAQFQQQQHQLQQLQQLQQQIQQQQQHQQQQQQQQQQMQQMQMQQLQFICQRPMGGQQPQQQPQPPQPQQPHFIQRGGQEYPQGIYANQPANMRPAQPRFMNPYGYPVNPQPSFQMTPDGKEFNNPGAGKPEGGFNQLLTAFNQTHISEVPPDVKQDGNTLNQDLW